MVDLKEFTESNYVSATDEFDKKVAVVITPPDFKMSTQFNKKIVTGIVEVDKRQVECNYNKKNVIALGKVWGTESKNWVAKKFRIVVATLVIGGLPKKTLVFEPVV